MTAPEVTAGWPAKPPSDRGHGPQGSPGTRSTDSDPAPPNPESIRLGPSAAGRCRRRIHLDAEFPEQRTFSAAARRAAQELTDHRERVFSRLRAAHPSLADSSDRNRSDDLRSDDHRSDDHRSDDHRSGSGVPAADGRGLPTRVALVELRGLPRPPGIVLSPSMSTATRSGGADLAIWVGDGYLPVIVRAHRTREVGVGARS